MKSTKFFAAAVLILASFASCGKPKNTELAAQAMERARAAEAPKYAPAEFSKAEALYKKMTEALNAKNNKDASSYADQTVSAANEAAARARENKAVLLIGELAMLLNEAQKQGIHESNAQAYKQASQLHIDASTFRDAEDYEKAIQAAQMGIDTLKPLISQKMTEARDLLEKARARYQAVSSSPAGQRYQAELANAKKEIDTADAAFKNKDYETTKVHAQNALDILNELAALAAAGGGAQPLANDSLQLQSYQLLRQLSNTIAYIKENGYTNDVSLDGQAAPQTKAAEPIYFTPPILETEEPDPAEEEIFIFMEEEIEADDQPEEDALSYLPVLYRAQNAEEPEVITFAMIEEKYEQAKAAYDEANYINAIDTTREGLRLADLFLAGQSIGTHRVIKGNTLWGIAGSYYNKRFLLWPHIWTANKFQIKDPDLIYPGQMFRIPPAPQPMK